MPTEQKLSRRDFLKLLRSALLFSAFSAFGGVAYSTQVEPGWLDVTFLNLKLPRLAKAFSGVRIVQISDIHIGGWMTPERLRWVVRQVLDLAPDLAVITGDFVIGHVYDDWARQALTDLIIELSPLTAQTRTLSVLGNHDHWVNAGAVRAALATCGVLDISNRVHTIIQEGEPLHIAGVDDAWDGDPRLNEVLAQIPERGAAILLAHEPDFADVSVTSGRFDLQLSGHTHGGQVVLPFIGPPILPHMGYKYPSGLYRVGMMWQYTNRGVGMARLQVRLNCRPEITVFTLEAG